MSDLGYEVDFLPVGDGARSGDAIALRFGELLTGDPKKQIVLAIDGGTKETGANLVRHIETYYGTKTVDIVVSSHPDSDHSSGLTVVMEQMKVGELWLHRPWEHSYEAGALLRDGTLSNRTIEARFKKSLDDAHELEKIANRRGITIKEPFAGLGLGSLVTVLGPSERYYESLLPDFRSLGKLEGVEKSALEKFMAALKEAAKKVAESLDFETLDDNGETSAENNSCAIVDINIGGRRLLFSADAGIPAITQAADFADARGLPLLGANFVQVPHHGSKRNVGPRILDRILGPKNKGQSTGKISYVSAAKEGAPKHPAKKVVNAFKRRGTNVFATTGRTLRNHFNAPERATWVAATPLPFYDAVDE